MTSVWNSKTLAALECKLKETFQGKTVLHVAEMPQSAEAWLVWALHETYQRTIVWISDGPCTLDEMYRNMSALLPEKHKDSLLHYPPWDALPQHGIIPDNEVSGQRLETLSRLNSTPPSNFVVATCAQALMQVCVPPQVLSANTLSIAVSEETDLSAMAHTLERLKYRFASQVEEKGQAALRGGILDVWPLSEPMPLRIEFFGAKVESIRAFDPGNQRSVEKRKRVSVTPASEMEFAGPRQDSGYTILSYLAEGALFVWSRPETIETHSSLFEEMTREANMTGLTFPFKSVQEQINGLQNSLQVCVGAKGGHDEDMHDFGFRYISQAFSLPRLGQSPEDTDLTRKRVLEELKARAAQGEAVCLYFDTDGSRRRFAEAFKVHTDRLSFSIGFLSEGFVNKDIGLVVVAEADLYGRRKMLQQHYQIEQRRGARPAGAGARVGDMSEIEPGDLVVHLKHGIGRYLGLYEIVFNGKKQEVLAIEYAEKAKLYVPVSHAHLLSRYVGIGKHQVRLHELGGTRWPREKKAAEKAIHDLAAGLLQTQAERLVSGGHAFPPDTPWQHEFEAAFPYRETEDQERAIFEVKADMENSRPMDRLVCGDAGYGKTEVAMRAAFKAVMDGKQVAVLVPTTVLAQQHLYTFRERMAAFPVRVEMLSRFCAPSQRKETLEGLRTGGIDILIGTHCLVEPGVRFRDLGLVIIDEEQRFGVLHKEKLKEISRLVDVLTLTATPIPRTLYMSLTGTKDLITIQKAPEERQAVRTIAAPDTDEIVREAIMREINREGQAFYLHNRIMTIERVKKRLERIVPEARIGVAHSRLPSADLAAIVCDFVEGKIDILLSTTIIGSGTDIPNANTILIDRPDRFGMAELYQLRGRVGRSARTGYAYLLLPPAGYLDRSARLRIEAIQRHSQLGAGFNIALRDLELRGAGNILGTEQSGHIAAVGFGLYCQLLRRTTAALKGETVPLLVDVETRLDFIGFSPTGIDDSKRAVEEADTAAIPHDYIEDERQRIEAYRKIAEAASTQEIEQIRDELKDRFGPLPNALKLLLKVAALRIVAANRNVSAVETASGTVTLIRDGRSLRHAGHLPRLKATTPSARLDELIELVKGVQED